ncbi:MAG: hypothetical protein C4K58_06605 [Flavobacteriaceae bacterium]|nr:MAG: hypothetical protein C4K58_06605 [Flavobacteriaceae bacterium]
MIHLPILLIYRNKTYFKMNFKKMIAAIGIFLSGSSVYGQSEIDSTNTLQIKDIIVTANKREENIIKVSTSITSLSSKKIEDTRTWGLSGLTALVPNYNYQELGVSFQQIQSIRGIQVFSENPAVSTYIDDVNNLDILANGFAFTDIERIEVLRGPQGTYGLPNGANLIGRNRSNNFGLAGFGELSYQLTKEIKATGGLRYDYEKREATFNGFGDAMLYNGEITDFKPDQTASGDYSALSPKFSLSYTMNDFSNLYATYTRGFRAGGINASSLPEGIEQTYDPEYSNNYEIGYKTLLLDKKLSIAASAFLIEWKDLQFYNLVAPYTYARENVGDAQSMGLELEVSALPIKGLQIDGSFGACKFQSGSDL